MSEIAIVVEFEIVAASKAALISIIRAHARRTKAEEPGCIRFDILEPVDEAGKKSADRLMLFELYRDKDAFDAHRASPNLPRFFADTKSYIKSRRATFADVDE